MGGRLFHFARLSGADRTTKLKRAATDAFLKIDDIKANEPLRVTSCAGS